MLLVCNYHYIRPTFPAQGIHGVTPDQFRDQLERLAKIGEFVSGSDIFNERPLPERAILITFDDGLREQYDYAWPILWKLGIPALFFVCTHPIQTGVVLDVHLLHLALSVGWRPTCTSAAIDEAMAKYPYDTACMAAIKYRFNVERGKESWAELRAWASTHDLVPPRFYVNADHLCGWARCNSLGTHGWRHDRPERDFAYSAGWLEGVTDRQVLSLSYPFGDRAACIQPSHGFTLGFTMERGINADLSRPLLLGRLSCADLPEGPLDRLWELPRCVWA